MQASTQAPSLTVEQFDELVFHPDYVDRLYEYIAGEMIEKISFFHASVIAAKMAFFILSYVRSKGNIGRVTGADGGFKIAGERYIPDVAYISRQKQPDPSREAYNSLVPDLVVEVISNSKNETEQRSLRLKITNYMSEGVLVWVVNPDAYTIEVHQSGQRAQVFGLNDTLTGGDVLPDLRIPVREIFVDVAGDAG